ncbi:hypothetical protein SprV_0702448000 [Sparganum proliferum]
MAPVGGAVFCKKWAAVQSQQGDAYQRTPKRARSLRTMVNEGSGCLRGIRSDQWSEAGLRLCAYLLQSHVPCPSDERLGTRIACRTDGHLLNQRRMHFQSRVSTTAVHELLLADDCALNATSEAGMKRSKDLFAAAAAAACDNFNLVINRERTVVVHQPPSDAAYVASQINVDGVNCRW